MKSGEAVIRLKMFQLQERHRQLEQLDVMMAEFGRMIEELDRQIEWEEHKGGVSDPAHFAYSPLARAARHRRDNLRHSIDELQAQKMAMNLELEAAANELEQTRVRQAREGSPSTQKSAIRVPTKQGQMNFIQHRAMIG